MFVASIWVKANLKSTDKETAGYETGHIHNIIRAVLEDDGYPEDVAEVDSTHYEADLSGGARSDC